jgi:methylenetetrahydrofolate reductase (NADPH)
MKDNLAFDRLTGTMDMKVSFEFSPPKSPESEANLWRAIRRLEPLAPQFVSVTYGAGGSTRDRTHATVKRIVDETNLVPAAHLTCVDAARAELDEVIHAYWDAGVRHIVALRGDPSSGVGTAYCPHPDGYASTPDLIRGIMAIGDFDISVSAYPEKHPESASITADLDLLKRKIDAGASRAITQFVFDTDIHARFRDAAVAAGISIPILPGIMPTNNFKGIARMAEKCGAGVPDWLRQLYIGLDDDAATRDLVAAHVAGEQVVRLKALGFDQLHFYTLNKADLVYAVCHILGLRPGLGA